MLTVKKIEIAQRWGRSPARGYRIEEMPLGWREKNADTADAQRYFLHELFASGDDSRNVICLPRDPDDLALVGRALLEIAYGPLSALAIEQEYKRDATKPHITSG